MIISGGAVTENVMAGNAILSKNRKNIDLDMENQRTSEIQ